MTPFDAPRFAQVISALAIATRGELDDPTIELYARALEDVPINLLEAASIELARESTFFPRPAEWRVAVDKILDRQERLKQIGSGSQLQLPGEVGAGEDWRCPDCDNTGWVQTERPCERRCHGTDGPHTHSAAAPCGNTFCAARRRQRAEEKKRYSRKDD